MAKRHWTSADFVMTEQVPAYDGSSATNDYGYCRKCQGDMQRFGKDGKPGPLRHYGSHGNTRAHGLRPNAPRITISRQHTLAYMGERR